MDYELVLNPSNTDLFPDQSMISKSPPYIVKSTLTRPATQPSRPRSVVHVPLHHIVHYSLSSSSGLSPTPPNPQRGRNRHRQPSGESCSSRRRISDWPRSRHSTCSCQQLPAANSQHLDTAPLHSTSITDWTVAYLQLALKDRKIPALHGLHFHHRSNWQLTSEFPTQC